jgi:hypothetical protein
MRRLREALGWVGEWFAVLRFVWQLTRGRWW